MYNLFNYVCYIFYYLHIIYTIILFSTIVFIYNISTVYTTYIHPYIYIHVLYSNQLSGYHIAYFRTLLLSKKLAHCKTDHHGGDTEVLQFCGDP